MLEVVSYILTHKGCSFLESGRAKDVAEMATVTFYWRLFTPATAFVPGRIWLEVMWQNVRMQVFFRDTSVVLEQQLSFPVLSPDWGTITRHLLPNSVSI